MLCSNHLHMFLSNKSENYIKETNWTATTASFHIFINWNLWSYCKFVIYPWRMNKGMFYIFIFAFVVGRTDTILAASFWMLCDFRVWAPSWTGWPLASISCEIFESRWLSEVPRVSSLRSGCHAIFRVWAFEFVQFTAENELKSSWKHCTNSLYPQHQV